MGGVFEQAGYCYFGHINRREGDKPSVVPKVAGDLLTTPATPADDLGCPRFSSHTDIRYLSPPAGPMDFVDNLNHPFGNHP